MRSLLLLLLLVAPAWAQPTDCPGKPGAPVEVRVGLFVLDFNWIHSNDQSYSMIGYLVYRWKDPRLAHKGPAHRLGRDKIWFPLLDVANAQDFAKVSEEPVTVESDGSCSTSTRFKAVLNCPFDLQSFPFDSTDLLFEVQSLLEPYDRLHIITDGDLSRFAASEFEGEWEITEKGFTGNDMQTPNYGGGTPRFAIGRFSMPATRRWQYYLWIYFIPLFLVIATTWTVFWTNPPNIQVTTTALLGAIMHRIAVGQVLPRLHLLTYADGFFLVNLFWILASNVGVCLVLRLDEQKSPRRDTLRRLFSIALPVSYILMQFVLYKMLLG